MLPILIVYKACGSNAGCSVPERRNWLAGEARRVFARHQDRPSVALWYGPSKEDPFRQVNYVFGAVHDTTNNIVAPVSDRVWHLSGPPGGVGPLLNSPEACPVCGINHCSRGMPDLRSVKKNDYANALPEFPHEAWATFADRVGTFYASLFEEGWAPTVASILRSNSPTWQMRRARVAKLCDDEAGLAFGLLADAIGFHAATGRGLRDDAARVIEMLRDHYAAECDRLYERVRLRTYANACLDGDTGLEPCDAGSDEPLEFRHREAASVLTDYLAAITAGLRMVQGPPLQARAEAGYRFKAEEDELDQALLENFHRYGGAATPGPARDNPLGLDGGKAAALRTRLVAAAERLKEIERLFYPVKNQGLVT